MNKLRIWLWCNIVLNGIGGLILVAGASFLLTNLLPAYRLAKSPEEFAGAGLVNAAALAVGLLGLFTLAGSAGSWIIKRRMDRGRPAELGAQLFSAAASLWALLVAAFLVKGFFFK